jgi:hypothetical protein
MDEFAARHSCIYWVEKSPSHSLKVDWLATTYPDAKFIYINRELESVVASALTLLAAKSPELIDDNWLRRKTIIRIVGSYSLYNRVLKAFDAKSDRMIRVRYQSMQADLERVLQGVCLFLKIAYEPQLCNPVYTPNTSFRNENQRKLTLSTGDRRLIRVAQLIFDLIPLRMLVALSNKSRRKSREKLPSWFFSFIELPNE